MSLPVALDLLSWYSFGWGTASPELLVRTAKQRGYRAVALTDQANLRGLGPFLEACREEELTPIVGGRLSLVDGTACLIAADRAAYHRLCGLLSEEHLSEEKFLKNEDLLDSPHSLLLITDSPSLLAAGREAQHPVWAALWGKPGPARRLADRLGLPTVAMTGAQFLNPADHRLHHLLRAIHLRLGKDNVNPHDLAPPGAWLPSARQLGQRFQDFPEVLKEQQAIFERITFHGPDWGLIFPGWQGQGAEANQSAPEVLRQRVEEGLRWRYPQITPQIRERLEKEMKLIISKGFAPYFLVVQDIVRQASRLCGRGSAAASLVAYCLRITNVDPIKFNLYFERFLNEDRLDPPDIDVDFAWDERDDILDAVFEKYGLEHTAMVGTHQRMRAKAALHETARAFGLTEGEIRSVTRHFGGHGFWYAATAISGPAGLQLDEPWPEIIHLANQLLRIPRHMGVHCGGVVLTPEPMRQFVPVQQAPKGVRVIQWEKDFTEEFGLVKMDLLGNRSLAVVRDALAMLKATGIQTPEENHWKPEDDPQTQDLLAKGNSMGVFYVESPAMRQLQIKTGKGDFEHLVIHSSIIRPAAMRWINEYVLRLRGKPYQLKHPALADLLSESYGILCYQEDVTRVCMAMAGFSQKQADKLRKALGNPEAEQVTESIKPDFVKGCLERGVSEEVTTETWEMIESFSGYSFCKPHSASYAVVSFQSAWLKAHHPAPFMAAVLKNGGGFYSPFAYVSEARRLGLTVKGPCVNTSKLTWWGAGQTVQAGLRQIKGLHQKVIQQILKEREANGPFVGAEDFYRRTKVQEAEELALSEAGALESLAGEKGRSAMNWSLLLERQMSGLSSKGQKGQLQLDMEEMASPAALLTQLPPLALERVKLRLNQQYQRLGFLPGLHPLLALYRRPLEKVSRIKGRDIAAWVGESVKMVGWYITSKPVRTVKNDPMSFMSFEDETAIFETVLFPNTHRRFINLLLQGGPFLLEGKVENDLGAVSLHVKEVLRFPEAEDSFRKVVKTHSVRSGEFKMNE